MSLRVLWLEDDPLHQLDPEVLFDLPTEKIPSGFEILWAAREKEARAHLADGPVVGVVIDTVLEFGEEDPEDGIQVFENLIKDGVLPEDVPRIVYSGRGRDHLPGSEDRFPHWFKRDTTSESLLRRRLFEIIGAK